MSVRGDATEFHIAKGKDSKDLEIQNGLIEIQKMETDIIKLAEVRSKQVLIGKSTQELDNEIYGLTDRMKWKTRKNLELQGVWIGKLY